jgi:hypothetical protein
MVAWLSGGPASEADERQEYRAQPERQPGLHRIGGKFRINPRSFASAAKLVAQNGTQYSLKICQRSRRIACGVETLNMRAHPMTRLSPTDVSHNRGDGSKYAPAITRYQIR